MIRLLGPPPPGLLARGHLTQKFFSEEGNRSILLLIHRQCRMLTAFSHVGNLRAGELVGEHIPLEQRETSLDGEEKEIFLCLVRKMLHWEPEKRSSAGELEQDEWVQAELRK